MKIKTAIQKLKVLKKKDECLKMNVSSFCLKKGIFLITIIIREYIPFIVEISRLDANILIFLKEM